MWGLWWPINLVWLLLVFPRYFLIWVLVSILLIIFVYLPLNLVTIFFFCNLIRRTLVSWFEHIFPIEQSVSETSVILSTNFSVKNFTLHMEDFKDLIFFVRFFNLIEHKIFSIFPTFKSGPSQHSNTINRNYLLREYTLTHTTAWNQHWGGDETLRRVMWLQLA